MQATAETTEKLNKIENDLDLTFPKALKNFLLTIHDLPLMKDSYIFCNFNEITTLKELLLHGDNYGKTEYWNLDNCDNYNDGDEESIEDTEYEEEYYLPAKDDVLLIGSNINIPHAKDFNYDWDAVMLGIRRHDLKKKNPPVYINYHYHCNPTVWFKFSDTLSEFLLMVLLDSLWGLSGKTAVNELKNHDWKLYDYSSIYDIQYLLASKGIDIKKTHRVSSLCPPDDFGAAFKMGCCYDKDEHSLYLMQYVGRAVKIRVISHEHQVIKADKQSPLYKEIFKSPLNLFTMQDFVEVLNPDFIYTGHERITQNGDDRIVISVYACDEGSKCTACNEIEKTRTGDAECKKSILCPFCGEKIFGANEFFSMEQWLALRIDKTAIMLKRTCMTYYCSNMDCPSHNAPFNGYFNSLNLKNDISEIDGIYTDFIEDKWNYRQLLELLGLSDK